MAKPLADLPKVPLAISYAKSEDARQLIQVGVHAATDIARPFVMPPSTPKDRVLLISQAFLATLKDPGFIAEAEKSKLGIDPVSGAALEKIVAGIYKMYPACWRSFKRCLISPIGRGWRIEV